MPQRHEHQNAEKTGPSMELSGAGVVGRRLRAVRKARLVRVADLATLLGRSPAYVTNIEKGRRSVSLEALWHWCAILEVEIGQIVTRPRPEHVNTDAFVEGRVWGKQSSAVDTEVIRLVAQSHRADQMQVAARDARIEARRERRRHRAEEALHRLLRYREAEWAAALKERERAAVEGEEHRSDRKRRRAEAALSKLAPQT